MTVVGLARAVRDFCGGSQGEARLQVLEVPQECLFNLQDKPLTYPEAKDIEDPDQILCHKAEPPEVGGKFIFLGYEGSSWQPSLTFFPVVWECLQ